MIVIVRDIVNETERAFTGDESSVEEQLRSEYPGLCANIPWGDIDLLLWDLSRSYGKCVEVPEGKVNSPTMALSTRFDPTPHNCDHTCPLSLVKKENFVPALDAWVLEKAIRDIEPGDEMGPVHYQGAQGPTRYETYDYTHVLAPHHRQDYTLHVHERNQGLQKGTHISARLYSNHEPHDIHNNHTIGVANGTVFQRRRDGTKHLNVALSEIEDEKHRGQGLGSSMYEALFAHAKHYHEATHISGGQHSTLAHKTHTRLSQKHGMEYTADHTGSPDFDMFGPGEFDDAYGPYKYEIKSEEIYGEALAKMAISDIEPGKTIRLNDHRYSEAFDYTHVLPVPMRRHYGVHIKHRSMDGEYSVRVTTKRHTDPTGNPLVIGSGNVRISQEGKADGHPFGPKFVTMDDVSLFQNKHRGKGLGMAMYEAAFAHAKHHFKAEEVRGGIHSSSAHKVHQRLSEKHGLRYFAEPNDQYPSEQWDATPDRPYDAKYDRYTYTLKSELAKNALEDDALLGLASNLDTKDTDAASEIAEDMVGFAPRAHSAFEAARFLVNGDSLALNQIRRALWLEDGDFERAALRAYDVEPTEKNVKALRAVMALSETKKNEQVKDKFRIEAPQPEAQQTASEVQRAIEAGLAQHVNLNGKYSKGAMVVRDPQTKHVWLLKPDSEGVSPAAGVDEEEISQPRREAAFWQCANVCHLQAAIPRADLIVIDGEEWAAIKLLSYDYKNMEKRAKTHDREIVQSLEGYRSRGTLHKWAVLDYILGNPDRHGQNLMISCDDRIAPSERTIALIDHGSAFAGHSFAPSKDSHSFIPFYLRAWANPDGFNKKSPADKLGSMPTCSPDIAKMLGNWIATLDEHRLTAVLREYGLHPDPVITRLADVKAAAQKERPDMAINKLWVGA